MHFQIQPFKLHGMTQSTFGKRIIKSPELNFLGRGFLLRKLIALGYFIEEHYCQYGIVVNNDEQVIQNEDKNYQYSICLPVALQIN